MICVYGNGGVGSFAAVTNGMREAAEKAGLLAGFHRSDEPRPFDERSTDGYDAPVAVICGDPGYVSNIYSGHKLRYLVLSPNSNGISPVVKAFLTQVHMDRPRVEGFLAPSKWAAKVLRREFPDHDVITSPHGVDGTFRYGRNKSMRDALRADWSEDKFYVLHVTSTGSDRKGTPQLIEAWRKLGWRRGRLVIYCHPIHLSQHQRMAKGLRSVAVLPTMSMTGEDMYLNYSSAHVVCQPSRAEGFGICPLEALCSGVPIVATATTGHSQYIKEEGYPLGNAYVYSGDDGPSDDYPGATAPMVKVDEICNALEYARENWELLQADAIEQAPKLAEQWTWSNQNEPALRKLIAKASEDT